MKKLNENLSEIFDIEPIKKEEKLELVPVEHVNTSENEIEEDFSYARNNIKGLISKGSLAVENILEVAKASEHPRAYEVAANLLKTMADMNKDLLDMQKKKRDLTGEQKQSGPINVDKAVFVGSTADLIKKLKSDE